MQAEPVHRAILASDIQGYARPGWTDPIRVRLRARLRRLLNRALARAAIDLSQVDRQDTGDGELLLFDANVPLTRLLHAATGPLATALLEDNANASLAERLRLRLALHTGTVLPDRHGHAGESLNHVARLLNAQAGRTVLDIVPEADIVLLVSEAVYAGVVRHGYQGIDPASYQEMWVSEKETTARAWVHLPLFRTQPRLERLHGVNPAARHAPPTHPIPHELPRDVGAFVGREDELRRLQGMSHAAGRIGAMVISAIDGMGGVGKSTLAIHAAHRLMGDFPDGQLYLDLHGSTPGMVPLAPITALVRLLDSLGIPAQLVPPDLDAAAARWRSHTADRRLLIVLDNAASAAQVAPLLPGSPTSLVLVTSRRILSTLRAADHVRLDILPPPQAIELLATIAGRERVHAEADAAADVARLCGYLPLALQLAATRLVRRPDWTLRLLADRLSAVSGLDELADSEIAVRASLEVSYQELARSPDVVDRQAAQAFRLLSVLDAPTIAPSIAARLCDRPEQETAKVLERLVDARLLQPLTPGRYRLHDLLRQYGREHAVSDDPEPVRLSAFERVLDCYVATARQTSQLLQPDYRPRAGDPTDRAGSLPLNDYRAALDWLDREQANMLAIVRQSTQFPDDLAARTVQLVLALGCGMVIRAQYRDSEMLARIGVSIARRLGDEESRGALLTDLGKVCWRLAKVHIGPAYLHEALAIFESLGDLAGQARALSGLVPVYGEQGRWRESRSLCERGLQLSRDAGDRSREAAMLANLAEGAKNLGEMQAASTHTLEALAIFRELGDRYGEGVMVLSLGQIAVGTGHLRMGLDYCDQAIQIARELGNRDTEAEALSSRGEAHRLSGQLNDAVEDQEESLSIAREIGSRLIEANALRFLGLALRDSGRLPDAVSCWRGALCVYEQLSSPHATDVRRLLRTLYGSEAG